MVNKKTIEEFAAEILATNEITAKHVESFITYLVENKDGLETQRISLQTNLDQIKGAIKDLVKDRATFFAESKTVSEVGEERNAEFNLARMIDSPEKIEYVEKLFGESLEELITKKCELEKSLKEIVIRINGAIRDKGRLEKTLEIEVLGKDMVDAFNKEADKEWVNWQNTMLSNELAKRNQRINGQRVMIKRLNLESQQMDRELYLVTKPLPSLPKESKFQQLGTKIKTQFQTSAEKTEVSDQKLTALIESKTK